MLRVLQLIPTLDRSGAEKQMVLLAAGLPRDRFQVEVATLTRLGPLEADLRAAGIPVTNLGKRFKADGRSGAPLRRRRAALVAGASVAIALVAWGSVLVSRRAENRATSSSTTVAASDSSSSPAAALRLSSSSCRRFWHIS